MLSTIRKLLDNWFVRALFVVLIAVFLFWGVSSVVTGSGGPGTVATVGGHPIKAAAVKDDYQRALNDYASRNNGKQPDKQVRHLLAERALGQAVDRTALSLDARRLGVVAPPKAIRQQVFSISAFDGSNGKFDKATFNQVLAQHNLTPSAFMADIAGGLTSSQIIDAVGAGAGAPPPLVDQIFSYAAQERTIGYVQFPFAAETPPSPPATHVLRRYWRNHPGRYSTPALRTARIIVLSPQLIASSIKVSHAALEAQYQQEKSKFSRTASRTVEIITADDEKSASALASRWKGGADWAAMKKAAAAATATAITFTDAKPQDLPSDRLAKAVFAALPGEISKPLKGALGTYVFKVTKANPGGDKPLSAVEAQVRKQVQERKARDMVDATISKLQDALAGDTAFAKLPADLHLAEANATFDKAGDKADGKPAAIPGDAKLRKAIVKSVFSTAPGNTPRAISGPGDSYYAIAVHKVIKPALKPFATVKADVLADWTGSQVQREAEVAAAHLLTAVKSGQTLAQAADTAGLTVTTSKPMTRSKPAKNVPQQLMQVVFTLKKGAPTMVQTNESFVVAVVTRIAEPKSGTDTALRHRIAQKLDQAMQNDVLASYSAALRKRDHVSINSKQLNQISD